MGVPEDREKELDALGARIKAARDAQTPVRNRAEGEVRAASIAWRMLTELIVGVMIGGAIGWGIDSLFGSLPLFLIVFGILGFVAGVKAMLRSAEELTRSAADHSGGGRRPKE